MSIESKDAIYIVGAGHAGGELALSLRQQGSGAPITIVGEEAYPPYRTALRRQRDASGRCGDGCLAHPSTAS